MPHEVFLSHLQHAAAGAAFVPIRQSGTVSVSFTEAAPPLPGWALDSLKRRRRPLEGQGGRSGTQLLRR